MGLRREVCPRSRAAAGAGLAELPRGRYRPQPMRRVYVPRPSANRATVAAPGVVPRPFDFCRKPMRSAAYEKSLSQVGHCADLTQ